MKETAKSSEMLTVAQVAAELNISLAAVYALIYRGALEAFNLAPESKAKALYRIKRTSLDDFLNRRRMPSPPEIPERSRSVSRDSVPDYFGLSGRATLRHASRADPAE